MQQDNITSLAEEIIAIASQNDIYLSLAESCTGGLVSAALTDVAGASKVFQAGYVTYSNEAKMRLLGVSSATLAQFGAVSAQTAQEMAKGALWNDHHNHHDTGRAVAISITGIAGPSGGTAQKPVGLVYFGIANSQNLLYAEQHIFKDEFAQKGRNGVRDASVKKALHLLYITIKKMVRL